MPEHMPLRGGTACDCGWNYGLSLNDTRSDMNLFLAHHREAVSEQIAQAIEAHAARHLPTWLRSNYEDAVRIAREVGSA